MTERGPSMAKAGKEAKASKPAKSGAVDSLPAAAPSIEMDVSVPALADADSLAGTQPREGDSAIKKILRAVNGGRELPGQR